MGGRFVSFDERCKDGFFDFILGGVVGGFDEQKKIYAGIETLGPNEKRSDMAKEHV